MYAHNRPKYAAKWAGAVRRCWCELMALLTQDARVICNFPISQSQNGNASVVMVPINGTHDDERRLLLHGGRISNRLRCHVGHLELRRGCKDCSKCPCKAIYSDHGSPYVLRLCDLVAQRYACDFSRAILVGLGIGLIRSTTAHPSSLPAHSLTWPTLHPRPHHSFIVILTLRRHQRLPRRALPADVDRDGGQVCIGTMGLRDAFRLHDQAQGSAGHS